MDVLETRLRPHSAIFRTVVRSPNKPLRSPARDHNPRILSGKATAPEQAEADRVFEAA